jgi:hypothetical protein
MAAQATEYNKLIQQLGRRYTTAYRNGEEINLTNLNSDYILSNT